MLRTIIASCAVLAATASECRVDQPDAWYDPSVSHHLKHAESGAIIGVAVYSLTATVTESRADRYATAIAAGAIVGVAYEVEHASRHCYADPVDAAWVTVGAAVGALAADVTGQTVSLLVRREEGGTTVGATIAWRF